MVKVFGLWEFGYSTPIQEFDLWHYPLREYGVDELIMSPVSGIDKEVTEVVALENAILHNPSLTPVILDENGDIELQDFDHPEDVLYIFGKASRSMLAGNGDMISVKVKTPSDTGMLWPHQVAVMVLHDRWVKSWR